MVPADISFWREMYIRYPLNFIWSCIVHSVAICTHPHSLKLFGLSYSLDAFHHLLLEANISSICWLVCWFEWSSDLHQKEQRFAVVQVIAVFSGLTWQRQQESSALAGRGVGGHPPPPPAESPLWEQTLCSYSLMLNGVLWYAWRTEHVNALLQSGIFLFFHFMCANPPYILGRGEAIGRSVLSSTHFFCVTLRNY